MTTPDISGIARAPSSPKAGFQTAEFQSLLDSVIDVAYRTAYQFTGSATQAESLVGDAALQASRQRATCPKAKEFKSWFLRIVTTLYSPAYRNRKCRGWGRPGTSLWSASSRS